MCFLSNNKIQPDHIFECDKEEEQIDCDYKMPSFIKIILKETDVIVFYEQPSVTVIKGSDEAKKVEKDNASYEFLTSEKGLIYYFDIIFEDII